MNRICVLCPTRDRPDGFLRLAESIRKTSDKVDLWGYVDDDQVEMYGSVPRDMFYVGPRCGPVESANKLARYQPGYDVYGLMTDDCVVETSGWDQWLLDVVSKMPNKICVVSPYHNHGAHVDMPFVTKEWMKQTGWFACPYTYHYCWPIITGLIGEMTAIVHAPEDRFSINHDYVEGVNDDLRNKDYKAFFAFVSAFLQGVVDKMRLAMYERTA